MPKKIDHPSLAPSVQIDDSVANNTDTDLSNNALAPPDNIDREEQSTVDNNAIIVGSADDPPLSQDIPATQDFSTIDVQSLQGNSGETSLLSVAPFPAPAVPSEVPELPPLFAASDEPIQKPILKRSRMKFKLQGIEANKSLFMNLEEVPVDLVGNVLASHVQKSAKRTDTRTCPGHVWDKCRPHGAH